MVRVDGPERPCLLLCLAVSWLVTCPARGACPRPCTCYLSTEVHCTFRYLTSVPDGFPPHVERVNLGYNSVARLAETDFSGLSRLELLLLHSNEIHTVPDRSFQDLRALQVLKLSYNKVRRLQKETFYGLWNLTRLHLDHNTLDFINPEAFYGLTALRLLQLEGNQLARLHPDTFVTLRYLEVFKTSSIKYLHLSDNLLRALPQEMLSSLSTLESLYLHGNPWTCDCHLLWLAEWIREKPDVIKCKKDRTPSSPQQCPLCTNPRTVQGQLLAAVSAAAFLCTPPAVEGSRGERSLAFAQGGAPEPMSPRDFMAPLGSLALNLTDQVGNEAAVVCSVGKPNATSSTAALAAENGSVVLDVAFAVPLVCDLADGYIRAVWQVLAPYSDAPLLLERGPPLPESLGLGDSYRQVVASPEDTFTGVRAMLGAQPLWLLQARGALWLNRAATTPRAVWLQWSSQARLASPSPDPRATPWTLILTEKGTKRARTVLAGETVTLHCPGLGDPAPHLEWLLADGSRVRTPHVSDDGRVLIHSDGTLELRAADGADTGTYRCISATGHDADVLTYWVTVVEPHGDAGSQGRSPQVVFLGESLDLPCPAAGSPDPCISWILPGPTVLSGPATDRHVLSNGTLSITRVTRRDQGLYRCVAANPSGVDMLTHSVAVRIKGWGSGEQRTGSEGSGFEEPEPPPAPRMAPALGAASGRLIGGQRRARFREQRRQRLPSVRRIDPRHWAALLEKAKRRGEAQVLGSLPGNPAARAAQLPREEESSGLFPLGEEVGTPAATTNRADPAAPPEVLDRPPTKTPMDFGGSRSGSFFGPPLGKPADFQLPGTGRTTAHARGFPTASASPSPEARAPSPLPHEVTASPRTGRAGSKDRPRGGSLVTARTRVRSGRVGGWAGGAKRHQPSVAGPAHPHPSPSAPPAGSAEPAQAQTHRPRSRDTYVPSSRPFAGRRRIWGRGPHRTPAVRPHRYGLVRPRLKGAAAEGISSVLAAPRVRGRCPSCTGAEQPLPSPVPGLLAPVSVPSLQLKGRTTETSPVEHFSTQWTWVMTETPTPAAVDKPPATPAAPPGVAGTSAGSREAGVIPARPRTPTSAPVPTAPAVAGDAPRRQGLARSPSPREGLRAQRGPGRQRALASVPPNTAPAGSPRGAAPLQATRLPPLITHAPSTAPATTTAQTRPPGLGPMAKALPSPPLDATMLHLPSPESRWGFLHMQTAPPTTTTAAPRTRKVHEAQTDRIRAQISERGKGWLGGRGHQHLSAAGRSSPTTGPVGTLAGLTPAGMPALPSVPGFIQLAWGSTEETSSPAGRLPRTQNQGPPAGEPGRTQALEEMGLSATALPSWGHQSLSATNAHPTLAPLRPALGPGGSLMPTTPSSVPWDHPRAPPVFSTRTEAHRRVEVPESSSPGLDPEQPAPETGTLSSTGPGPTGFTSGTARVSWSPFHPTAVLVQPPSPQWTPPPRFGENPLGRLPDPAATEAEGLGTPEVATRTPHWSGQRKAEDSSSREKPRKTSPTEGLPFKSQSRNLFERPRIVGGRAASYTVLANSDAFLPCAAAGNPPPTLRWTRVSSGLDLSGRKEGSRFQVLGNGTLSIQRVDIQDRGQYLCSVSNAFGSDHLYVTLSVVSYPPRMLEPVTRELLVHSGSTVALPCRADGRPHPSISWTLPNQTVVAELSEGDGRAQVTRDGTLVLRDFNVSDQGFYRCTASNAAGQDWLQVSLQVVTTPPVILEPKSQVVVGTRGHSLRLPCTATGTPRPRVHWVLPGGAEVGPLQPALPRRLLFANGTLQVSALASSELGTYRCVATSPVGSDTRVVLVTVEPRGTLPRIDVVSPTWMEVDLGASLLLDCAATGEPRPRILWRLPSKAVVEQQHRMGSRIRVYANGSLFIDSATDQDEGHYLCVARNPSGEDLMSLHVGLRRRAAQIAGEPRRNQQVSQGGAFRVDCPASGSPLPDISWILPDGTVARAEARGRHRRGFTLFDNGTLYFSRVRVAQQGDYTCRAQNTLGKDELRVHLTVIPDAPRIRPDPRPERRVQAGVTAVLDCEVSGQPPPTRFWLLPSGVTVAASKDRYVLHANGSLAIGRVTPLDSGAYVCVARNAGGSDSETYRLDVLPAPPHLHGSAASGTALGVTALRHSRAHLDCGSPGSAAPQATWLMPGDVMLRAPYRGGRISVHANGTLEIRNVRPSDAAEFVCVAQGLDGGERSLRVRLDVLEPSRPPTFRSPSHEKVTARLGQPTALDCSADGHPPPEILWVLPNGTRLPVDSEAGKGQLVISRTARSHAGRYRCAARNPAGYIEKLIVLEVGQRPVILTPVLGSVHGLWGESIWLHCVSDGSPKPRLTWTVPRGSVLQRPGPQGPYVLHENGTLVIGAAEASDTGRYVCQARNSAGQARITVPVTVVAYPPRITRRPPRSVLARPGAALQLSCGAVGVPRPRVTWEVPERPVMGARPGSASVPVPQPGTLILRDPQMEDSGIYTCTARNSLGSDTAATFVRVI